MSNYAFDLSNSVLLAELEVSAAKAGMSNSGFIIDVAGPMHAEEYRYLHGVVLSRLDGQIPPFRRGDVVALTQGQISAKTFTGRLASKLLSGKGSQHTVWRMWYLGNGAWMMSFNGDTDHCYDHPYFTLVTKKEDKPATPCAQ